MIKATDRFLLGIVLGIVILVAVAFGVAFLRPEPVYRAEDTPEGVVHNYLLAFQREELERAYGYLSPDIPGYPPSAEDFIAFVRDNPWEFRLGEAAGAREVEVVSARESAGQVIVIVQETTFYQGGLFNSNLNTNTFEVRVARAASGSWRIVEAGGYWYWCWSDPSACAHLEPPAP